MTHSLGSSPFRAVVLSKSVDVFPFTAEFLNKEENVGNQVFDKLPCCMEALEKGNKGLFRAPQRSFGRHTL